MNGIELGLVVLASAVLSAAFVRLLLPILRRHALAHPNARSSHRVSTPQGGGIAVVAATLMVAAVASALREPAQIALWPIAAATVGIALVGAIDDVRSIGVTPRFALQTVAVGLMLASLPADLRVVPGLPWWFERALLLLACLWFVNLTNFMDGLDWMTVAEFVPLAAGLALLGTLGALPMHAAILALALCGALIGFAPFNRPVARIFLGDVGSLPIGLLIAWLLVLLAGRGHFAAALVLPLYYLADATLTLLRRLARREPVWQAHRMHFYQLATDRGLSVHEIVARVFAVNVALVALGVVSVAWPTAWSDAIAFAGGAVLVGFLLLGFHRGRA